MLTFLIDLWPFSNFESKVQVCERREGERCSFHFSTVASSWPPVMRSRWRSEQSVNQSRLFSSSCLNFGCGDDKTSETNFYNQKRKCSEISIDWVNSLTIIINMIPFKLFKFGRPQGTIQ